MCENGKLAQQNIIHKSWHESTGRSKKTSEDAEKVILDLMKMTVMQIACFEGKGFGSG